MQQFSIRDIENLTGIKTHTIRVWEQRYGLITPKRKESQHRFFDNDDLRYFLHIAFLYHNHWKISRIAALTPEQRAELVNRIPVADENYTSFLMRLLEAAMGFNEQIFQQCLAEIIAQIGFENAMVEVCYPFLNRVGILWSTGGLIPAQEHFSSYLLRNRILVETDRVSVSVTEPEILLMAPRGEHHEISLLFINYLLRKNGKGTIYLGTNTTLDEIRAVMQTLPVRVIFAQLLTNFTGFEVDDYFAELCREFPGVQIYAAGAAVQFAQRSLVNVHWLKTHEEIRQFVQQA